MPMWFFSMVCVCRVGKCVIALQRRQLFVCITPLSKWPQKSHIYSNFRVVRTVVFNLGLASPFGLAKPILWAREHCPSNDYKRHGIDFMKLRVGYGLARTARKMNWARDLKKVENQGVRIIIVVSETIVDGSEWVWG